MHATFRQEPGDMVFMNNWVTLHKRSAFEDWPETGTATAHPAHLAQHAQ